MGLYGLHVFLSAFYRCLLVLLLLRIYYGCFLSETKLD